MITLLLLAVGGNALAAGLSIENAWIREAPPGHRMMAGYMTLTNNSDGAMQLTAAASSAFSDVSIHRTVVVDGVSKMRSASPLAIAPGETVSFTPGGLHLMLMGPTAALQAGDVVQIELEFDGRDPLPVEFEVRRPR
jgi:copper(I)-binding protein